MSELIYRGDVEEDRRDAAVMHARLLDHIDRLQRVGFPVTNGDLELFRFIEEMLIEFPEGIVPPVQSIPPQGTGQVPPIGNIPQPQPGPAQPSSSIPAEKPIRGRIRPVN